MFGRFVTIELILNFVTVELMLNFITAKLMLNPEYAGALIFLIRICEDYSDIRSFSRKLRMVTSGKKQFDPSLDNLGFTFLIS